MTQSPYMTVHPHYSVTKKQLLLLAILEPETSCLLAYRGPFSHEALIIPLVFLDGSDNIHLFFHSSNLNAPPLCEFPDFL